MVKQTLKNTESQQEGISAEAHAMQQKLEMALQLKSDTEQELSRCVAASKTEISVSFGDELTGELKHRDSR